MSIAKEIVSQLGGAGRLVRFIGLSLVLETNDGAILKFPKSPLKVNMVKITLNGLDLYDIEFLNSHGANLKTVSVENDVYAEDLVSFFERNTGLYLSF
jgi:hypothetical protein